MRTNNFRKGTDDDAAHNEKMWPNNLIRWGRNCLNSKIKAVWKTTLMHTVKLIVETTLNTSSKHDLKCEHASPNIITAYEEAE